MSFLRALIPSWKFFDQVGSTVEVRYRSGPSEATWGVWQSPQAPQNPRSLIHLFFNAEENLWLAKKALLERLAFELYEAPEPDLRRLNSSLPYKLVQNWIEQELHASKAPSVGVFQFELRIQNPGPNPSPDNWLSAIHEFST